MSDVLLTGLGQVSALGNELETAVHAAWAGRAGFTRCDDRLWGPHGAALRCRVAASIRDFDSASWVPPRSARCHDRATAFALAAVAQAVEDAALGPDQVDPVRVGVVIGQAAPGNELYHQAMRQAFLGGGAAELPGRMLPQLSGHIATALVAMKYGFRGPTLGIVDACASGASALVVGADLIRAGRADVVLAGGTDAPVGLTIFGSMLKAGAMNPTAEPARACRPFCADRAGLIVGEAAGVVVLESESHARVRGAVARGRLLGASLTNEAHHLYSPEPTGARWAEAISSALAAAGLHAADVDAVSAHAASTPLGDLTEVRALKRALGARAAQVPVFATKSMHGHALGAAGAVETVLALAAMNRGRVLPTAHLDRPDAACDLDHVPDPGREGRGRVLLKNAFGFGGTNTVLLIEAAGA